MCRAGWARLAPFWSSEIDFCDDGYDRCLFVLVSVFLFSPCSADVLQCRVGHFTLESVGEL